MIYYYYPSLPEPVFLFDYTKTKGFFIDTQSWQISLNLANTPFIHLDHEFLDYFYSLSLHEIAHYVYCPYDNLTNMRLLAAAMKGGVSKYYAPIIVNIFSDLIIDYRTHKKFGDLMDWELKISIDQIIEQKKKIQITKLWKILVSCYETLWRIKILPKTFRNAEINELSRKISSTILNNYEDESLWEKKVKKIAKLLKDILKEECSIENISSASYTERKNGNFEGEYTVNASNSFSIPTDVLETFGNLSEVKNLDMIKSGDSGKNKSRGPNKNSEIESAAEEIASELDSRTFTDILSLYGLSSLKEKLGIWYRSKAKNLLKFHLFEKRPSGAIPVYPKTWRIGDSIEELDPVQTLLTSPVIIPNITTRKWVHKEGPSHLISKELPDMMIVIDSSGSMDWNFNRKKISGRYHISLLAAFAALHYAINHGSYVSAINFSSTVKKTKWTNNFYKIEQVLLNYQGQGTVLPTKSMLKMAKSADRSSIIILISDLELYNWESAVKAINSLLDMGHILIAFFITGDEEILEEEEFQDLITKGAKFYCIHKMKDLIGLVISEVQEIYDA